MKRFARQIVRLLRHHSGVALTEFALSAPLLMGVGLWGVETANQAIVQMRINQIAVLIADNASRVGENSLLGKAQIYESDINDVLYGAHVQGGDSIQLLRPRTGNPVQPRSGARKPRPPIHPLAAVHGGIAQIVYLRPRR